MTIAAIIGNKGEVVTIAADTTVREAANMLSSRKIGALPVVKDGRVDGIMSERDIIYCLSRDGAEVLDWTVDRIMTSPAITVASDQAVMSALSLMTRRRVRHLPVVEDDQIIGIVSIGDLVKFRMDQVEQEAAAMLDYIQSA